MWCGFHDIRRRQCGSVGPYWADRRDRSNSETATGFSIELDNRGALGFLPGQYVNIKVPGTDQTRSYSFSSGPKVEELSFLLRNMPTGALSTYLRERALVGHRIEFHRPLGSFYLRPIQRPLLFLAGGTGLAPFLAMLEKISDDGGSDHPIHLIFGVTNDPDLVELNKLEAYTKRLRNFTFTCTVAEEGSRTRTRAMSPAYIEPPTSTAATPTSTCAARRRWSTQCGSS